MGHSAGIYCNQELSDNKYKVVSNVYPAAVLVYLVTKIFGSKEAMNLSKKDWIL